MPSDYSEQTTPFVCNLNAIEPEERERHLRSSAELFQRVQGIRELPDGYAFRFPAETDLLLKLGSFIAYEKLCCPFFGFTLQVEPQGQEVWLHLTGQEGIKPFIRAEVAGSADGVTLRAPGSGEV